MLKRSRRKSAGLTASAVLRRLAELEERGIAFYQGVVEGTKSDWVRKLAEKLIRAEQRHKKRFLAYAERAEAKGGKAANALTAPLPPEVVRLLNTSIFVGKDRVKRSVPYAKDLEVLKVAIRAEEHAALLLGQLKPYIPHGERPYITRVINEEWGHKDALEQVRNKHFPGR